MKKIRVLCFQCLDVRRQHRHRKARGILKYFSFNWLPMSIDDATRRILQVQTNSMIFFLFAYKLLVIMTLTHCLLWIIIWIKSGFVYERQRRQQREDTHTWKRIIYHMPKKQQVGIFLLYEFNDVASNKAWDKSWGIFNELCTHICKQRRAQR